MHDDEDLTSGDDLTDLSPQAILASLSNASSEGQAGASESHLDASEDSGADSGARAESPATDAGERAADLAAEARAREIYSEILGRNPEHDFDPTIDRVASLMELLGDPQDSVRAIHITGTNGKTSTARMIETLLHEMGLRTGRFTSPHLHTVRERISIDTQPISAARFVEIWDDVAPYVHIVDSSLQDKGQSRLSFFEVLTALAYAAFADAPVDVAVIEVGMGGEWDSTNVVDADVAVFTPIAKDHDTWLGTTLEEIAGVKAGIIKSTETGQVVISARQDDAVEQILAERANGSRARILAEGYDLEIADRQVAVGGQLIALRTPAATYADIFLPLFGAHQAENALLALAAVEALLGGRTLPGEVVEAGFAAVTSPGRLELVRSSPAVLVDAAHNPAAARALVAAIDDSFTFSRLIGVIGVMADKDADGIFAELEGILDEVVITQSTSMRSMDPVDLAEIAQDTFDPEDVHLADSLPDAIALAVDRAEQGQVDDIAAGTGVLVAGSVVLAAEVRALFGHR